MTPLSEISEFNHSNNSLVALFLIALVITGCSKLKNDNRTGSRSETSNSSPPSNPASVAPSADGSAKPITWETTAKGLDSPDAHVFTFNCPPGGVFHSVWGSDIYTGDSSICTAAVHRGLITFERGGRITIELRKGRNMYGASERNGVTTSAYGSWPLSFVFQTSDTDAVVRAAEDATPILWNTSATTFGFTNGQTFKCICPAGGKESSAWGTDIYTLDSSICTAAVHVGKIQLGSGGPGTIERRPGEANYKGSLRNGITTRDYEHYDSSFIVK